MEVGTAILGGDSRDSSRSEGGGGGSSSRCSGLRGVVWATGAGDRFGEGFCSEGTRLSKFMRESTSTECGYSRFMNQPGFIIGQCLLRFCRPSHRPQCRFPNYPHQESSPCPTN